ncbi:MAG: hypothetical protein GXN96_06380 [Aquificae bacterium]|nr:hypothetical protein [Aquificota bacterium]
MRKVRERRGKEGGAAFKEDERMKLIAWTSVLLQSGRFPRDEGKPYLPGEEIRESLKDALVYYSFKKDKNLEKRVRDFLRRGRKLPLGKLIRTVESLVLNELKDFLENLKIPGKIPLREENLKYRKVEIYDLKRGQVLNTFRAEVLEGVVEVDLPLEEKIRPALHSYCEALAHAELTLVRGHPLEELFYRNLPAQIKEWEFPLRLGFWTTVPFGGRLFWFWGDKEVRNRIRKLYGLDVRPRRVLYFPSENKTAGWSEVKRDA